jgi:hypothetical protein
MAQTIQLKHSYSTGSFPTGLADGEVAINLADHQFWVGSGSVSASALKLEQVTASGFSASQAVYGNKFIAANDVTASGNISASLEVACYNVNAFNGDFDGTLEADAITVGGVALSTVIAGTVVDQASTAESATVASECDTAALANVATTVTVTDSTANTNFPVVFNDESNRMLDDTGTFIYNPSTGLLTFPKLATTTISASGASLTVNSHLTMSSGQDIAITDTGKLNLDGPAGDTYLTTGGNNNTIQFVCNNTVEAHVNTSGISASNEVACYNINAVNGDFDGTLEADAITIGGTSLADTIAGTTVNNATLAGSVTVTDSTADAETPVVFHNESNGLRDDTGTFTYNAANERLTVPDINSQNVTASVVSASTNVIGTKHLLPGFGKVYINDDPFVQNSVYFGHSTGNQPYNWNDPQAAGGTLGSTSTITITEDDFRWGHILPFDVSEVEIQCSLRPGGACTGDNFFVGLYTAARPDGLASANYDITLVAHNDSTFAQGKYKTNDFTYTGDLAKGTLIFIGIGSEDSTAAKNAPGLLNVIITKRS